MTSNSQFANGRSSAWEQSMAWLQMVYLTICFFLAAHDPLASTWDVNRPAEAYALTAGSGSAARQISFLMLALYAIAHIPLWRSRKLQRLSAAGVAALALCAWTFLSGTWTDSFAASGARLLGLLTLMLVASAVCFRFRPEAIVRWVGAATVAYAVTGVICELALGAFRPFAPDYRFSGTLHPNEQGVNCAIAAIAVWHLWWRNPHRLRWLSAFLFVLTLLLLTKSRTACFSAMAALVLFNVFSICSLRRRLLVWCAIGILVTSAAWLQWNGAIHIQGSVQLGRDSSRSDTQSLTGRVPLWDELLGLAARHSVLGYGYGGFWTPERITDLSEDQGWGISASHSAYIDMLLALGPAGVALYTASLLLAVFRAIVGYRPSRNIALGFCGTVLIFSLVNGIADSGSVNVSSFLCFASVLSLFYIGFVPPSGWAKLPTNSLITKMEAAGQRGVMVSPKEPCAVGASSVPSLFQELS